MIQRIPYLFSGLQNNSAINKLFQRIRLKFSADKYYILKHFNRNKIINLPDYIKKVPPTVGDSTFNHSL